VLPLMPHDPSTIAHPHQSRIDDAFERRADITPANTPAGLSAALDEILQALTDGRLRVAEKVDGTWVTHQWIKKAVLLYFRTHDNRVMPGAAGSVAFDKVPLRFTDCSEAQFREGGFRVVPPAAARAGAFIGRNVVLMPSYVNVGAYVDEGTMVDTWATVGSCAQIGKNVHLSGGVGIGGVLEPLQANPTIIEDGCFIGARSEVVEGVIGWASSLARARRSTTAPPAKCTTGGCRPAPSWCPAACRRPTAATRCRAR
jgi:2,3,4,5-tetrahydropyridine-2-carboxylate N-succinyltransferase